MATSWTEADADIGGARLHYLRTGKGGKRPLVLVHGFTDAGPCWTPVARMLESRFDVIMPDMRGHGLSARVAPGEAVDMPADLARFIGALKLERPIVCGHSMGAMTTFQAAVRFPDAIAACALEDPPWWMDPWPAGHDPNANNPFVDWAMSLPSLSLESLLEGYRRDHPAWPEELVRAMAESKKRLDPSIAHIMSARMNPADSHWRKTLGSVRCPLLVMVADPALGGIVSPEVADMVTSLNPRARVVRIAGAGHLIRFDAFDAFMAALSGFLAEVGDLP